MPGSIRYHADEDINHAAQIASALRQRGIAISTSQEVGLLSVSDEQQLAFATHEGRVLLTHNIGDFRVLHDKHPDHAGILFIQQGVYSIGQVIRGLVFYWENHDPEALKGQFSFLSQSNCKNDPPS